MFCLNSNVEDEVNDMHVQKKDEIEILVEEKDDVIKFEDQGSVKEKLHFALMVSRLMMDGVLPWTCSKWHSRSFWHQKVTETDGSSQKTLRTSIWDLQS